MNYVIYSIATMGIVKINKNNMKLHSSIPGEYGFHPGWRFWTLVIQAGVNTVTDTAQKHRLPNT
jgi:hypothetical protein